jgi:hypothetical protein
MSQRLYVPFNDLGLPNDLSVAIDVRSKKAVIFARGQYAHKYDWLPGQVFQSVVLWAMVSRVGTRLLTTAIAVTILTGLPVSCSGGIPTLAQEDWASVPEIEPVWVLEVREDSAKVIFNRFVDEAGQAVPDRSYPTRYVRVGKSWTEWDSEGHLIRGGSPRARIAVRTNGTLVDQRIDWGQRSQIEGPGTPVGRSMAGQIALFKREGFTEVRSPSGRLLTELPYDIGQCLFFDVQERILAVADRLIQTDRRSISLHKMLLLDYAGKTLYAGEWTECGISSCLMGLNANFVQFSLDACIGAGDYLLRVDEKTVYSLGALPQKGKRFSSDYSHVLLNDHGEFSFFSASNPESTQILWREYVGDDISAIAISDEGGFIAYRSVGKSDQHLFIGVLSGADGSPLCKLLQRLDQPAPGPLAFSGAYLFSGMGFGWAGWDTEYIYLFDLTHLKSQR